ncbi:MAG TPA: uL15 family ribosomal protein [Thermoplasmata archaeon]|nr:uL15 family ribosomal protein [Thermoplasmata archaeon]
MVSRTSKFRGSRTHGRGKKAGRGAGLHGGRGNAGLHKHKYITLVKYMPDHFGRHGFKRPQSVVAQNITINLSELEMNLESLKKDGFAEVKSGKTVVDLRKAGIDKLLGSGRITVPVEVIVDSASARAKEKLAEAGGKLLGE